MTPKSAPGRSYPKAPLLGASACIWDRGNVLLVLGTKPPKKGLWSLPGGLVKIGETLQQAAARELFEETGMTADFLRLADWVEVITREKAEIKYHFVIAMFVGQLKGGELKAGDDAGDARWFGLDELPQLEMTKGTAQLIRKAYDNGSTEQS